MSSQHVKEGPHSEVDDADVSTDHLRNNYKVSRKQVCKYRELFKFARWGTSIFSRLQ